MKSLKYIFSCLALSLVALSSSGQETNRLTIYHSQFERTPSMTYTPGVNHQIKIEPDTEAPYVILSPDENKYFSATPQDVDNTIFRLYFNETVTRGSGTITYTLTGEDGKTPYAGGTINNRDIEIAKDILHPSYRPNGILYADYSTIHIPIPEDIIFRNREKSYLYLDFEAGAFVDYCGNPSAAMKGGINDDGVINAPWGEYNPNVEGPVLINVPDSYHYVAFNMGRSIILTFNKSVWRGNGKIAYLITDSEINPQTNGYIDNGVIDDNRVTITLPEGVELNNSEISYIFLDLKEGAFVDSNNNPSAALKGGIDENGGVSAPWWKYDPNAVIELELNENTGVGDYYITYYSTGLKENTEEEIAIALTEKVVSNPRNTYAVFGLASFEYSDPEVYSYIGAEIEGGIFKFYHRWSVGIGNYEGAEYYISVAGVTLGDDGVPNGFYEEDYVPFTPSADNSKILETDITLAYIFLDQNGNMVVGIDVLDDCRIVPASLVNVQSAMKAFKPTALASIRAERVKAFVKDNVRLPYKRGNFLR